MLTLLLVVLTLAVILMLNRAPAPPWPMLISVLLFVLLVLWMLSNFGLFDMTHLRIR